MKICEYCGSKYSDQNIEKCDNCGSQAFKNEPIHSDNSLHEQTNTVNAFFQCTKSTTVSSNKDNNKKWYKKHYSEMNTEEKKKLHFLIVLVCSIPFIIITMSAIFASWTSSEKNGDTSTDSPYTQTYVLTLNKTSLVLREWDKSQLIGKINDESIKNISWSSDNIKIATVDSSGLVSAVSAGATTIRATCTLRQLGNIYSNCSVIVTTEDRDNLILNLEAERDSNYINIPDGNKVIADQWSFSPPSLNSSFTYIPQTANSVSSTSEKFLFKSNIALRWKIENEFGTVLPSTFYLQTVIEAELKIGIPHTIYVTSATDTYYTVYAYAPNGIFDITGYTRVNDKIRYNNQVTRYKYMASKDGEHSINFPDDTIYKIKADAGSSVTITGAGQKRVEFIKDVVYTITIYIEDFIGNFSFSIGLPYPNISGKKVIRDRAVIANPLKAYFVYQPAVSGYYYILTSFHPYWTIRHDDSGSISSDSYTYIKRYDANSDDLMEIKVYLTAGTLYTLSYNPAIKSEMLIVIVGPDNIS
ncbi:MAG: Ig-like domain-containing protein [Christensenellaceae bacterium]|jgi:hypothetical protein|nr:Ig-like domain-containing protein [Christensenellaceae bacterium]